MSLKADIDSGNPVRMRAALRTLCEKVERLEREAGTRAGELIGETEMGDKVYAVAPRREGSSMVAALREGREPHG